MPAPYPRALRPRIAALNRLPVHRPRDLLVRDIVEQRAAHWPHHFKFSTDPGCQGVILPRTDIGFETIHAMGFHQGGPRGALVARYSAIFMGLYPPLVPRLAHNL